MLAFRYIISKFDKLITNLVGGGHIMTELKTEKAFYLEIEEVNVAVRYYEGGEDKPSIMWFGEYLSSMLAKKPTELQNLAKEYDYSLVRWDYSGYGESGGDLFKSGFANWFHQAELLYNNYCKAPTVLVGSSLGGWLALNLAKKLAASGKPVKGLVLLAPAIDFINELLLPRLSPADLEFLAERGFIVEAENWSILTPFTQPFIDQSQPYHLLNGLIETNCPIHIIHGVDDPIIPYTHSLKLMEYLPTENTGLTMIKEGDHRLSRPEDLKIFREIVYNMLND